MGDRRRWERPRDMTLPSTTGNGSANAAVDSSDPVLEKQRQYIKMLEERNRLKKKLAGANKAQQREKEREEAFVTTFNVPPAARNASATAESSGVRKNKSSASLLPTRMCNAETTDRTTAESKCQSAPATVVAFRSAQLGCSDADDAEANEDKRPRRAKWAKPAQGAFAVENRNGKARLCIAGEDDEASKTGEVDAESRAERYDGSNDDLDDDEYLEESFEEFEDDEEAIKADAKEAPSSFRTDGHERLPVKSSVVNCLQASRLTGELVPADNSEVESMKSQEKPRSLEEKRSDPSSLSQTTTQLMSLVQSLSRSKQKALIEVLNKFQASDQQDDDIKELKSSIGDPAIWKQITASLISADGPIRDGDSKLTADTKLCQLLQTKIKSLRG
ncbi:hypothetical protein PINS_up000919 [Pythium insidiosum]|nr:hypothetical protein PINS_up000919 [Pythium insidiosum]